MKRSAALIIVATAAILWGFIGLCTRALSDGGLNSLQINGVRGFVCTIVLGAALLVIDRVSLKIHLSDIWKLIMTALAKFGMDYCFITAQIVSDLSLAGILLSTDSFFIIIISMVFFRKGITPMKIIATFLGFFGCTLVMNIMSGIENINVEGVVYGLGSGFFGAIYASGLKVSMNAGYKPYAVLFYTFLIGSFIYIPIMDIPFTFDVLSGDMSLVGYMLALSLVFTLLPYYLYTAGLNELEPITAIIILFLEAVVSALIGVICFNEPMTAWMVLGMAVVLGSTILMEVKYENGKFSL